ESDEGRELKVAPPLIRQPPGQARGLPPSPARGEGNTASLHIKARQSQQIPASARLSPRSARPTSDLRHPALVPSQGRARSAGDPKRRRERRERGPCRIAWPSIARAGQGSTQRKAATVRRAVQECRREQSRERAPCLLVVSSSPKG